MCDCGDSYIEVGDVNRTMQYGADFAASILQAGAMPIIIGGEHKNTVIRKKGLFRIHPDRFVDLDAITGEPWHIRCYTLY